MAEQRLIDGDWLLDVVENVIEWDTERDRNRIIHQVRELTPTIEERKTGTWIDKGVISNYPEEGFNNYHLLVCDQCGCMHRTTVWCVNSKYINANFCPNCGCRMKGEEDGQTD